MADDTALNDRILLQPYELRCHIYSFVYCIDYDALQGLRTYLQYTDAHHIPPRKFLLKEPLYVKYREQNHSFKSDDESWARLRWPDNLENAFLTVKRLPTSYPIHRNRSPEINENEFLCDTVSTLTGIERNKKECSSHRQTLRNCSPIAQSERDALPLIDNLLRMKLMRRYALAEKLCSIFYKMKFGRGISVLEKIHPSVSPALLAHTANIYFQLDKRNWEFEPWHRLRRDIFPCLQSIDIDLDFKIDNLLEGDGKSLWTRLEEHMQGTVADKGRKQVNLWLKLHSQHETRRILNHPETIQRFKTVLSPKMAWRDCAHHPKGELFVLTQFPVPSPPKHLPNSYPRGPDESSLL